jgi:superfamily II DNA or RNA helicase
MPSLFQTDGPNIRFNDALRRSQLGALWAIGSHFTTSDTSAIVAMPTGTGKTLVALLAPYLLRANRVLVLTPSRLIRHQVASQFRSLSLPLDLEVLPRKTSKPTVKQVLKRITDSAGWEELRRYDVVVSTPNAASPAYSAVVPPPQDLFDLLIIDEAHHSPARTWQGILDAFPLAKKVLLTATPYRRDRREITGSLVYVYPIADALADGTYAPIEYVPATPMAGDRDGGLVHALLEVMQANQEQGLIAKTLVRTDSIKEGERLLEIYRQHGVNLKVVHSRKLRASNQAISELRAGLIDGLVCVDMLGEGFDLPSIKTAVLHSPHRSLPATLQFVGRLARVADPSIGPARVIAIPTSNPMGKSIESTLLRLYQRDSDWQLLIPGLAAGEMESEIALRGFFGRFRTEGLEALSLRALRPSFKATLFLAPPEGVDLTATPEFTTSGDVVYHAYDEGVGCAVWVTRLEGRPSWVATDKLILTELELHIAVYDASNHLLFLQSSSPATISAVKEAIAPHATRLDPSQLDSLLSTNDVRDIFNIGIANIAPRAARRPQYTMYAGRQADAAIRPSEVPFSTLGHASALIQDLGSTETEVRGASMRSSTVWSSRRGTIFDFVAWCHDVGRIIAAAPPSHGFVSFAGTLTYGHAGQVELSDPVSISWPAEAYQAISPPTLVRTQDGAHFPILGLALAADVDPDDPSNLIISTIVSDAPTPIASFTCYSAQRAFFPAPGTIHTAWTVEVEGGPVPVVLPLPEYFTQCPPPILLASGTIVAGPTAFTIPAIAINIPAAALLAWDWTNVDIQREALPPQGATLNVHGGSVRNIEQTWSEPLLVMNDHGSGEIADIIAVSDSPYQGHAGRIGLFHCKSSSQPFPNFRVDDVIEVAGQAIKSFAWYAHPRLFEELASRLQSGRLTILHGTVNALNQHVSRSQRDYLYETYVVQPGLPIEQILDSPADPRLSLLAVALQWYQSTNAELVIIGS